MVFTIKAIRMKNKLLKIFDIITIPVGLIIVIYGFINWRNMGFVIENWSDVSTNEGRAAFSIILLGIGLILYGLFDYWAFRRKKKIDDIEV
jgi:membrane protein DedA with SNARE-associated domain